MFVKEVELLKEIKKGINIRTLVSEKPRCIQKMKSEPLGLTTWKSEIIMVVEAFLKMWVQKSGKIKECRRVKICKRCKYKAVQKRMRV